jgi:hypothetical protein
MIDSGFALDVESIHVGKLVIVRLWAERTEPEDVALILLPMNDFMCEEKLCDLHWSDLVKLRHLDPPISILTMSLFSLA